MGIVIDDKNVFDADATDYHAHKYSGAVDPLAWHSFESRRQRVMMLLPAHVDVAVDLGCGTGAYLEMLSSCSSFVVAMDFSRVMLSQARSTPDHASRNFVQANVVHLPLHDASVHLVTCIGVVEYLPDPAVCLREIARVLKPDGRAILSVPNAQSLWRMVEWCVGAVRRRVQRLLRRKPRPGLGMDGLPRTLYSARSMTDLVKTAGLELDSVVFYNSRLPLIGAMSVPLTVALARWFEKRRLGGVDAWISGGVVLRCRPVKYRLGRAAKGSHSSEFSRMT